MEIGDVVFPNHAEDSGSAYEESGEELLSSSLSEEEDEYQKYQDRRLSKAKSASVRGRSQSIGRSMLGMSSYQRSPSPSSEKLNDSSTASPRAECWGEESEWAATFRAPESPTAINTPRRHVARKKREAFKSPSQIKSKRLKSWYNPEYRNLLNVDIYDAVSRSVAEHQTPLEASQIGCATWTPEEKDAFFSSLSRLGRDDVRGIAARIETKSEMEVHEYIQLLHHGMLLVKPHQLLHVTELPAAVDISEECSGVLERAGDALAIRQERAEEEVERAKWDDLWLLNTDVNKLLERQVDREETENTLPAVNLFVLGNWLELSRRIFMNSNSENENWEDFAEINETPAIRATAFEDFHSLAVSVTKRLISTTLFCTMSRQRAMGSNPVKHADVNEDDVEAAAKILGLKTSSREFWLDSARRCNLRVFDEEFNSFMSYDEAEKSLRETRERSRSRSRSFSRRTRSVSHGRSEVIQEDHGDSESISEDWDSEHDSDYSHDHESLSSDAALTDPLTDTEMLSRRDIFIQRAKFKADAELAHENYISAFDASQSQREEQRLWTLLGQTAPFEVKDEPMDLPDAPKGHFRDDMEQVSWRDHLEYRAQWEEAGSPVPNWKFENNRKRISGRARRQMRRVHSARVGSSENSEDGGGDNDETEETRSVRHHSEGRQDDYHYHEHVVNSDSGDDKAQRSSTNSGADRAHDQLERDRHNHRIHPDPGGQVEYLYPASQSPPSGSEDTGVKREYDSSE